MVQGNRLTPPMNASQQMLARIGELEQELAKYQKPPPPGARLVHLWVRGNPDVVRFIATKETADAAEAVWDSETSIGLLGFESYPDGNGRRQRLSFRIAEITGAALDRPTAMSESSIILPQTPQLLVPG